MKKNLDIEDGLELQDLLIDVHIPKNEIEIKKNKEKQKYNNMFIDESILNKLFFFWSFKSTYFSSKTPKDYSFTYYSFKTKKNTYQLKTLKNIFSLLKNILSQNISLFLLSLLLSISSGFLEFYQFTLFKQFLSLLNISEANDNNQKILYKAGLKFLLCKFIHLIIEKNAYFYENYLPKKISNNIIILIYQKTLSLNEEHNKDNLMGKIINLIQTDVENISFIFNYGPRSLIVPIQIIIVLYNVYILYDKSIYLISALLFVLVILFILGYIIQKKYIVSNTQYLHNKDIRIHSTNEILNNLKEIKMNNLENFFEQIIDNKRKTELEHYNDIMNQGIVNDFLFFNSATFLTMGLLIYLKLFDSNITLKNENIITLIFMFNKLCYPLYRFPVFITGVIDAVVSYKRIFEFFNYENEKQCKNLIFDEIKEILKNDGVSICILGPNGGGKTYFIKEIIKNKLINDNKDKLSFCSQEKFILDNNIRNNILFGNEFNEKKYLKTLKICELIKDIDNFQEKDLKECKIDGSSLSGGQKSRVDLARAVYNDSDYYFFDDIFVSFDKKVGLNIFEKVIINTLKNNNKKIAISFSNINFLNDAELKIFDYFIIIDKLKIVFKGNYNEFINSEFYSHLKNSSINLNNSQIINNESENILNKTNDKNNCEKKNVKKVFKESKLTNLFDELGFYFSFGLFFYETIFQLFNVFKTKNILQNYTQFSENKTLLNFYLILCIIGVIFAFMKDHTLYKATFFLNKKLSKKIIHKILLMPLLSFMNITQSSDIINRLSSDVENIRKPMKFLIYIIRDLINIIIITIFCINYTKIILFLVGINILFSWILYKKYISKAKEYNNLERETHTPLILLFQESLKGNFYIQVYKRNNFFNDILNERLDNILKMNIIKFGGMSMFQLYHELLCILNLSIIVIYSIKFKKNLDNNIYFLLSYSVPLIDSLCSLFHSLIDIEINKIYFDRLSIYDDFPQEDTNINKNQKFEYGDIQFCNISMKYNINSELVLKNISLTIQKGKKIAIVGRTGCGKSTLILLLLRLIQDRNLVNGDITINNKNINKINLNDLRKNISIITQKPFIFNGCSLKENIDPNNFVENNETLLKKIKSFNFMKDFIEKNIKKENDLDKTISDFDLSEGEKEIICLCRVMIKKNKIIVLDEATSNIDLKTEEIIYKDFIKLIPEDTTLISIIHKLDYVKFYDEVFEMSENKII